MNRTLTLAVLVLILNSNYVKGNCHISLKTDFGKPSPVYLHNGGFLAPNTASGDILLRRSETIQVACPGNGKFVVLGKNKTNINVFNVKCVRNNTFRGTKSPWVGNFSEIKCNAPPWFTTEEHGSCYGGNKLYRVGYKINSNLYSLYEACFNGYLLNTLYVKETVKPSSNPQSSRRPAFIEGDLFGKVKISKLYKAEYQKKIVKEIFGNGMDDIYITKKQFLSRGHLAPRADFALDAEQRATFHYVNTAPQWLRGNAGDWAALEEGLRRRINGYGKPVVVYTGTYGVCTLADADSKQTEFYLDVDENNNGILPVPLYFFKIVHDPERNTAVAFLSINSSYYNSTMIEKLAFCDDVCQDTKFSWLKWRSNDGTHSFCCSYEDFIKKINILPKLIVKELFY